MCRVTGPAGLALWRMLELGIVTCGTAGLVRRDLQIFICTVTLETLYLVQTVSGIIPLLVDIRGYLPVTGRTGGEFLLFSQLGMLPCRSGSGSLLMACARTA